MDRQDVGSWIGGPLPDSGGYRGQRLGLPEDGPGSMARLGRRVAALFIDWFAALLVSRLLVGAPETGPESFATLGIFFLEVTVLTWLSGSSFGQRLMGLRVVGIGQRLGFTGSAIRTLLICLVIPPLIWDSDGRGLHDKAVGSVVIRV
jgi:uncharacterized RDD family membrane protein YckC